MTNIQKKKENSNQYRHKNENNNKDDDDENEKEIFDSCDNDDYEYEDGCDIIHHTTISNATKENSKIIEIDIAK